jgi:hypothetical protein
MAAGRREIIRRDAPGEIPASASTRDWRFLMGFFDKGNLQAAPIFSDPRRI